MIVPAGLRDSCEGVAERSAWLADLPHLVRHLAQRWSLRLGEPFDGEDVSSAWVAPAIRATGEAVVFKIGMPHMEGRDEIAGLRFWNGEPTVHLLDADESVNAMLLERCPGRSLRFESEPEQDHVIAALLRRLWRTPPAGHSFRPLAALIESWIAEATPGVERGIDRAVVREGTEAFRTLCAARPDAVILATDLHAANVLAATRQPWLVIDPKPFVGDPAYDATQHLLNCRRRLRDDPLGTIQRFADLLQVDATRVRMWLFARAAAGPERSSEWSAALVRALA